ncbi:MAG TPA: TipAS antibiotic-recognition domain-containing protein, partial [Pyrinomonadaceae bacterium]|nr:TipAS antibiotic-recognition domain-containing protein [Pyrinomonadaceae bacterium]
EAIERAERETAKGDRLDWETFKKIIEVINMQNNMEWMKKYYTEEQLAELAERGTPEVIERGRRDWAALIKDVEVAVAEGVDPGSERGQELASRWSSLIEAFTGGNPEILKSLKKLYADESNWPDTFRKPYGPEVTDFIEKAMRNAE